MASWPNACLSRITESLILVGRSLWQYPRAGFGPQMTLPNGSRERRSPFCTRKGVKDGIGEWKGPFRTLKGIRDGCGERRGRFRTPMAEKPGCGE